MLQTMARRVVILPPVQDMLSAITLRLYRCSNGKNINRRVFGTAGFLEKDNHITRKSLYLQRRQSSTIRPGTSAQEEDGTQQNSSHYEDNATATTCTTFEQPTKPVSETFNGLSEKEQAALQIIKLEYDILASQGGKVPTSVSDEEWLYLLHKCPSIGSRSKRYHYLVVTQNAILKAARKKAERQEVHRKRMESKPESESETYKNTMLQFQRKETYIKYHMNKNGFHSMEHGPHLVIDCAHEKYMKDREISTLVTQLQHALSDNRELREPLAFHFCNISSSSLIHKSLRKVLKGTLDDSPLTLTPKSYLDLYPKEKLVYLSPHAKQVLTEYDPDKVYIVGALVDLGDQVPHTLATAKREGITACKLPLDEYIEWDLGSKCLTLHSVISILGEMYKSGDWRAALRHVPKRKIRAWKSEMSSKQQMRLAKQRNTNNQFKGKKEEKQFSIADIIAEK